MDTNQLMASLAAYMTSQAKGLHAEITELLQTLEEMPAGVEELLEKVEENLEKAEEFYESGNYIAANYWALQALELMQQILEIIQ